MTALVVSIGATHPWNIAGVGLDARVCVQFGLDHAMAVAVVTAQNGRGVFASQAVEGAILRAQFDALPRHANAYRVGALLTEENVRATARFLRGRLPVPCVVDPVFLASTGEVLAQAGAVVAIRDELAAMPVILTPNLAEASRLLDRRIERDSMVEAARALQRRGPVAVLLKGGHLDGSPTDVLATVQGVEAFESPRLANDMRGTGCVLAAALACELANGVPLREAVERARAYVAEKIAAARDMDGMQVAF